jgi:imidazoleglycerol phosphate synthase glutamine amidotransferase subunit HisH
MLTNSQYDLLKNIVELVLPAAGTLYFTLATIWHFPNGENVVGSIAAVNIFLGVCLGVSSKLYKESEARFDGDLILTGTEDESQFLTVELNPGSADLTGKEEVIFKVKHA